jgi:hypothetical protein
VALGGVPPSGNEPHMRAAVCPWLRARAPQEPVRYGSGMHRNMAALHCVATLVLLSTQCGTLIPHPWLRCVATHGYTGCVVGRPHSCNGTGSLWAGGTSKSSPRARQTTTHRHMPATTAPGLGPPQPHLHRDWAHPSHTCTGAGLLLGASRVEPPPLP